MKKLFPILLIFVLLGAGCSKATTSKKADGGVWKTADQGKTWISSSVVPTAKGIGTLTTANVITMEMDAQDNSMLYVGTREDGFLYSDNAGTSWHQPRNRDLATGFIPSIQVSAKDVCTLYVVRGPRLYKSTDCMRSFSSDTYVESRPKVEISFVALDWFNPETVWLALSNGDLQKSMDGGKTWSTSLNVKDVMTKILISQVDSRVMLIGTQKTGIQKTVDGGETWQKITDTSRESLLVGVNDLIQTKSSDTIFAATKYGLVRSTDFGDTWSPIKLVTAPGQVAIRAIGVDWFNPSKIFYATTATFYQSSDAGVTWKTGKLPSARVPRAMLVDPKLSSVIYLGAASEVKK
ncbi:MAG: YCF48-related protein [Patescibacteria group bacterium]